MFVMRKVCSILIIFAVAYASKGVDAVEDGQDTDVEMVEESSHVQSHFAIIIDCGSSGTRATMYHWKPLYDFPEMLDEIEPVEVDGQAISHKVNKGLSTLGGVQEETEAYFEPILQFIEQHTTEEDRKHSAVFILGTAGMRLIEDRLRERIIDQTTKFFRSRHDFALVRVKVITGADEGMFMWVTVNSGLKNFSSGRQTGGIIEMGGASVQVTYEIEDEEDEYLIRNRIGLSDAQSAFDELFVYPNIARSDKEYRLVSSTFLGLGSNRARDAYLDMLVMDELRKSDKDSFKKVRKDQFLQDIGEEMALFIRDPCYPTGVDEAESLIMKPKTMLKETSRTIGFSVANEHSTFAVAIVGDSNFRECHKNVTRLINLMRDEKMNCENPNTMACSMSLLGSAFIPFDTMTFHGIGDFSHTTSYLGVGLGTYNRQIVNSLTRDFCNLSHRQIMEKNPEINKFDPFRSRLECFKAVWVDVLLHEGFRMPNQYDGFVIQDKIRNRKPEWTLGAALEKSLVTETAIASIPGDWSKDLE